MCLVADSDIPYIAEEDIICYKLYILINDKYVSPYQKCDMPNINELVTTELQKPGDFCIGKGFHSFTYLEDAEIVAEQFITQYDYNTCIATCIIPKNSKYYAGKFDKDCSYCSESIKIEKITKFKKLKVK